MEKFSIKFYLESSRVDKHGTAAIRVRICVGKAHFMTSSGYKVTPANWDAERCEVIAGGNLSKDFAETLNDNLANIRSHFRSIAPELTDSESIGNEFAAKFGRQRANSTSDRIVCKPKNLDFWGAYEAFVNEIGIQNSWSVASYQKFNALRKLLNRFKRKIEFRDLTNEWFNAFVQFMVNKEGMKNTTIKNQLNYFGIFLRWATRNGYNKNLAFQSYRPKLRTIDHKVIFLEWSELMRLYHYAVPANGTEVTLHSADGTEYKKVVHDAAALEKSRDIFCFSAFTSLRYSDATNLKWTDVSADSISFVTKKTADPIVVELNDFSRAILQKYADRKGSERFVFPGITNQRMNVYIKEVCELCEINTPVTISYYCGSERTDEVHPKYALIGTHCGRRTFVCSSLAMGIPAEIVMKWTGHADYKTMKPYIGVADSVKGKFMQRFNMQEDE